MVFLIQFQIGFSLEDERIQFLLPFSPLGSTFVDLVIEISLKQFNFDEMWGIDCIIVMASLLKECCIVLKCNDMIPIFVNLALEILEILLSLQKFQLNPMTGSKLLEKFFSEGLVGGGLIFAVMGEGLDVVLEG
jgi:hypothetical protein